MTDAIFCATISKIGFPEIIMKTMLSILFTLFALGAYADDNDLPASCKPVAVEGESVILSAKKPQLMMIHNLSKNDLWITHPVSEPSASAGWSSRLQAGNWSALALDKESFELSCIESKPGHEQQVPCKGMITVCQWSTVNLPPTQGAGTYWAGENLSLSGLTAQLGGRGFGLPDPAK